MVYDAGWAPTEALVSGLAAIVDALGGGDRAESIARRLGPGQVAACDCSTLEPIARLMLSAEEVPPLMAVAGDATSCAALRTLAEHLVDTAARALAIRVGIRGEGHLLQRWAEVIRMTRAVGLALPCHAGIPPDAMHCPPWAGRYPAELHGVLSRLAAASDNAERMAAAAAGRLFTDRGRCRRKRRRSTPRWPGLCRRRRGRDC